MAVAASLGKEAEAPVGGRSYAQVVGDVLQGPRNPQWSGPLCNQARAATKPAGPVHLSELRPCTHRESGFLGGAPDRIWRPGCALSSGSVIGDSRFAVLPIAFAVRGDPIVLRAGHREDTAP